MAELERPPYIDPDKLRFDDFHDLAHPIWDCYDGWEGRKRHINYWWMYKFSINFDNFIHKWFLCKFGRHSYSQWWKRVDEDLTQPVRPDSAWETFWVCMGCEDRQETKPV